MRTPNFSSARAMSAAQSPYWMLTKLMPGVLRISPQLSMAEKYLARLAESIIERQHTPTFFPGRAANRFLKSAMRSGSGTRKAFLGYLSRLLRQYCRAAPMGTALQYWRNSLDKYPKKAFLVPDPDRIADFKNRLAALPGKKVGVCWRSMMLSAKRAKYFSAIDSWGEILKTPGISFVNIQYGDCAADIARAEEKFGVRIHQMEGLDLKDDIDGCAALCAALDLILSAPTAAAHTASSVGATV